MHVATSKSILLLSEKNRFNQEVSKNQIFGTTILVLENKNFLYVDKNCLKNLLTFLKVNSNTIELLTTSFATGTDSKEIPRFLIAHQNETLTRIYPPFERNSIVFNANIASPFF